MLKRTLALGAIALCLTILLIYSNTLAGQTVGGTVEDPLVTKSYVELRLSEIEKEIDSLGTKTGTTGTTTQPTLDMAKVYNDIDVYIHAKLEALPATGGETSSGQYQVIKVTKGSGVIGNSSTEIILRSGTAVGIGNAAGDGISDITAGKDIKSNETVMTNHLLIIPKTDGRGLLITSDGYVMIKGTYQITTK